MNSKIAVLLVEDNEMMCQAFEFCIEKNKKFQLVASTGRQSEGLSILKKEKVDVLLLDLELLEGDGITFMKELNQMAIEKPLIVVITNTRSERVLEYLRMSGVDFICQKNNESYSPENVLGIVEQIIPYKIKVVSPGMQVISYYRNEEERYRKARVEEELTKLDFKSGTKATVYLIDAIYYLAFITKDIDTEMKTVYLEVAKKHKTKAVNVEKAIRDNIERTWSKGAAKQLERYYPFPISKENGNPTNKEFLQNMVFLIRKI